MIQQIADVLTERMTTRNIGVCSPGDPRARSTWSGTPARICDLLSEMGRLDSTLDSTQYPHPIVQKLTETASRIYYHCSMYTGRGRLRRYLRARYVDRFFRTTNTTDVLHTSTLDLPPVISSGIRHYLFCDTTWDLWQRSWPETKLLSQKLLSDCEELEQVSYRQMSHIFPISEYVRQNLITHYRIPPERITVVGTG